MTGAPLFSRRRFWPQFLWIIVMCAGCGVSCIFRSVSLFIASLLVTFLGLTESSRWSHKKNLLVCVGGALAGSICGVFTWFETASVFVLLFAIGGFMFYYRDSAQKLIPDMEEFAREIAKECNLEDMVRTATVMIRKMTSDDEVFIAVADGHGGLRMPERKGKSGEELTRNGGAVWKVFASGRAYVTGRVEPSRDMPFYRDAHSLMSVALSTRGKKLGVLQIESRTPGAFSEDDLRLLGVVAFLLAQPMCEFTKNVQNTDVKEDKAVI